MMKKSGSRRSRTSMAARYLPSASSRLTHTLPAMWPQRFGKGWSFSSRRKALPLLSIIAWVSLGFARLRRAGRAGTRSCGSPCVWFAIGALRRVPERRRAGAPAAVGGGIELERAGNADGGAALRARGAAILLERHSTVAGRHGESLPRCRLVQLERVGRVHGRRVQQRPRAGAAVGRRLQVNGAGPAARRSAIEAAEERELVRGPVSASASTVHRRLRWRA